ncbi:hypothetical protein D9M68_440010 [compost metagenome]
MSKAWQIARKVRMDGELMPRSTWLISAMDISVRSATSFSFRPCCRRTARRRSPRALSCSSAEFVLSSDLSIFMKLWFVFHSHFKNIK